MTVFPCEVGQYPVVIWLNLSRLATLRTFKLIVSQPQAELLNCLKNENGKPTFPILSPSPYSQEPV